MGAQGATIGQYWNQLLADIGVTGPGGAAGQGGNISAQGYNQDLSFLEQWAQHETGGNLPTQALFNPLATTETAPGSHAINSAGVQAYTSLMQGAQTEAGQIMGSGMTAIDQALKSGNFSNLGGIEQDLNLWGTSNFAQQIGQQGLNLAGGQGVYDIGAAPGITSSQIDKFGAAFQGQYLQQLAQANQSYANQSANFQLANLNLSQNDLNTQLGALNRMLGTKGHPGEYLQNYNLNRQQLERQMTQQQNEAVSSAAASGSSFTHGTQENLANIKASRATQEQQMQINYAEQVASAHDRQKQLFDLAERYGISREQISARLTNQLANIQYSTDAGVGDLAMQMAQDDATIAGLAQMPVYPQATAGIPQTNVAGTYQGG